jgi:tetratricopeptide (TPR) repeat protein
MSRGSSLSALGRALRTLMGVQDGEASAEQVKKVKTHVSARLPRTLRFLSAFLGELIGVPFPDEADEPLRAARASAQLMQSRLRMALEAYVRAQAELIPQILVIEDMHWADDTTLDLVDWLLGCQELRFGVFAFARPELTTRLPTLWDRRHVTRLTLAPLSPLAADRLVLAALPAADAATRSQIVKRAGGNALFLEELVRCAADGRDELPLTVQALVQLRLDRMSSNVREVLRAAAVFGQSFWSGGVAALLERNPDAELVELQSTEIITRQPESRVAGQTEWIFRQALVRDAAYASVLEEDRAALHLGAGAWLESVGDVDVGLIARHADAGGDFARAAALYARATRQAYTNGAQLETALDLANRGLACDAEGAVKAQLLLAKAQVSSVMGALAEGIAAADEAGRLAPPGSDVWGEAQRVASIALIESGRVADGDARAVWALGPEFRASLPQPMRAALLAARVRGLIDLNNSTDALKVADEAVETARTAGSVDAMNRALDARLFALMHVTDMSEAVAAGETLIEAAEKSGEVILATRGRNNTASVLNHLGKFEEAQVMLERSLADSRSRRMRLLEAAALHNLGMSHARLGGLDVGIDYQRQAARMADESNAARLRLNARFYETIFLVWRGAPGDLGAALNMAKYCADETKSLPSLEVTSSFVLARVQLARHAFDDALAAARNANERLSSGPVEEWEEFVRLTLVEALLAKEAYEEADEALRIAFQRLVEVARGIRRADHREAFLTRNDELVRILDLARDRLGQTMADQG